MSQPCVYTAYAEDESVLYIGHTDNFTRRMEWHRTYSPWTLDCWSTEVFTFPSIDEARGFERFAIGKLNPPWNWRSRSIPNPVKKPSLAEGKAEVARRRSSPDYMQSAEFRSLTERVNGLPGYTAPSAVSA